MRFRTGFTLIELLIVVTIISILAGAAIPYVQDYLDESRRSRAKNDLDEIRNALVLYEVVRRDTYRTANIASLVGPFLTKSINDPWGAQYVVNDASSTCYSVGPDGQDFTGDEIRLNFRPRMAVSKIMWYDTNQDGLVAVPDSLHFYVTRQGTGDPSISGLTTSWWVAGGLNAPPANLGWVSGYRIASYPLNANGQLIPGSDTVRIVAGATAVDPIIDRTNDTSFQQVRPDLLKVLAP